MADNRTLSITIVATSEKAQAELRKLADQADHLGLKTGAMADKVAHGSTVVEHHGHVVGQAFNAVQTAVNSVGASLGPVGEIFERFSVSLEHTEERTSKMRRGLQLAGAAMAAIGGVIAVEASKEQASLAQLKDAVDNTGKSWGDYREELEKAAHAQAANGHSAKDATDALTTLTAAFNDPTKAMEHMGLVADEAARQHISLADAAAKVASVVGGNTRVLKEYGIDTKALVDPTIALSKAQHDVAASTTALSDAQQKLSDFEARATAQREQGAEQHAARVEAAQQKLAAAQQHLADVEQRNTEAARARREAADAAVSSSTEKLASARQHLADVEGELHANTLLTLQDAMAMRDAQQSLADVQQKIADGQLAGADAATALRDAQQRVTDTQALQAEKAKQHAADVAKAQQEATKAAQEHAQAVAKASAVTGETTGEHIAHRDALAGVAKAHDAVSAAQASGSGGLTLRELQQERDLRAQVAEAAGKQKTAQSELIAAQKDADAYPSKLEKVLTLWQSKIKGAAEAQQHTLIGQAKAYLAEAENLFAGFGNNVGLALLGIGAALDIFTAVNGAKMLSSVGVVAKGLLLTIGDFVVEAAATLAPLVLEFLPIIAAVALVGVAVYELWKHWDAVWGFIKRIASDAWGFIKKHMDLIIDVALGPLGVAINLIRHHWDAVWGAIKTSAGGVKDFFVGAFHGLETILLAPWKAMIWAINAVIDAVDSIHFSLHLPSWAGGAGFDFKGFGIPHIPGLPSFSDGGVVPGRDGEPQLVIAHGGERILNRGQQAGRASTAPTSIEVNMVFPAVVNLDQRAADNLARTIAPRVLEEFHRMQNQGRNLRLISR